MTINDILDKATTLFKKLSFGNKRQLIFLEDLSVLVSDGVPVNRAIDMLTEIYTGISQEVAINLSQAISEGKPLAEAMRPWFNVSSVELVRAGEEGGTLDQTMHSAADALKEKSSSISAVVGAIVYPLVVLIAGCLVIIYINNSIFIDFKAIKPVTEWPTVGRALISLANFIQYWSWLAIIVVIGSIIGLRHTLINYVGELRPTLDNLPIFNVYRDLTAARLMETLGLLVSNGVVFKTAIKVLQYHANPYLVSHLIGMERLLGTGKDNIAEVLNTGLVKQQDVMRLRVIAEVKGFEHALIRLGKYAAIQGNNTIRIAAKITAGFLLAVGGGLIIFMIFAIYLVGMSLGTIS